MSPAWARDLAAATERERRLPDELVAPQRGCGLLQAGAPLEVAGSELATGTVVRCAVPTPSALRANRGSTE
jgi:hypothetical protein